MMKSSATLGIDIGTSAVKVAIFDCDTRTCLGHASQRIPTRAHRDGRREQNPKAIRAALMSCVQSLRAKPAWKRIRSIGLASQSGSTLFVNQKSGTTVSPLIVWNDGRATAESAEIKQRIPTSLLRRSLFATTPPAGLARLLWIQRNAREWLAKPNLHVGAGDWMYHALTGIWQQDAGSAIQIGSYNARTNRLDDTLLSCIKIPVSKFAPLRPANASAPLTAAAANRLGLMEGIPVAGPYFDQEASYIDASQCSKQPLQVALGTAWVGNFTLPSNVAGKSATQIVVPHPTNTGKLIVQPLLAAGVLWDAAFERFADSNPRRLLSVFRKALFPPAAVECFPINVTNGAGLHFPIKSDSVHADDLLRATSAMLVFEFRRIFESILAQRVADAIVLCGGASRAEHFQRLFAAVAAPIPVMVQQDQDFSVARGAVHLFWTSNVKLPALKITRPDTAAKRAAQTGFEAYCEGHTRIYGKRSQSDAYTTKTTRPSK